MNTVSFFLYAADVLANLQGVMAVFGIALILAYAGKCVYYAAEHGQGPGGHAMVFVAVGILTLASLIPSQRTVYLILGSEAAQMTAESEIGSELLSDVHAAVKAQLRQLSEAD